jgi:hypothetical protein
MELITRHQQQLSEHQERSVEHAVRICALETRSADRDAAGPIALDAAQRPPPSADADQNTVAADTRLPFLSSASLPLVAKRNADVDVQNQNSARFKLAVGESRSAGLFSRTLRIFDATGVAHTWELSASMWDASLFLGGRSGAGVGLLVTIWSVLLLMLNTLIQGTISAIVVYKMAADSSARIGQTTAADLRCAWLASLVAVCRVGLN